MDTEKIKVCMISFSASSGALEDLSRDSGCSKGHRPAQAGADLYRAFIPPFAGGRAFS
jgi:hypothetical protein